MEQIETAFGVTEKQKLRMDEISYQLTGGRFPLDDRLGFWWIPFVLSRLPDEDLNYLLYELNIDVVQVCANTVFKARHFNNSETVYVCFESGLCDFSQSKIIYIIAHEFAHAFLGHSATDPDITKECEIQADEQVIKWGFEKELKRSRMSYIIPGHINYIEKKPVLEIEK